MKTLLRNFFTVLVAVLTVQVSMAQVTKEPTVDGTLDVISQSAAGLVVNKNYEWQALIKGFERTGDMVNFQIKLEDPSQQDNFTLFYNSNREAKTEDEAVYAEVEFNEEGIAIVGPEGGEALLESYKEYFKINFTEPGTYNYTLSLLRADGVTLAPTVETARVRGEGGVTGIDDMIGEARVAVYPTILEGVVKLNLGKIRNAKVAVIDILGRTVLEVSKANGVLDISTKGYAKGTYFVKVFAENDVASSRLVVR